MAILQKTGGYRDPLKAMTIKALQQRQEEAARAAMEAQTIRQPIADPLQGIAHLTGVLGANIKDWRTNRALAEKEQGLATLMGQIDPMEGATQEQLAAMGSFDPEVMKALFADRSARLRRDQWEAMTPEQRAAAGVPEGAFAQREAQSGKIDIEAPSAGVTVQNLPAEKGQTEWEKENAKNLSAQLGEVAKGGYDAIARAGQVELLEGFLPQMFQTGSENMIAQWMQQNWGINLGDRADAATAFNAIVNSLVPEQRPPGSGTMSDRDVLLFQSFLPKLSSSPQGNRLVIGFLRGMANYRRQMGEIANRAMAMGDPKAARDFFYTEAGKLANPLAGIEEQVRALGEAGDGGAGGGDTDVDAWLRRNGYL